MDQTLGKKLPYLLVCLALVVLLAGCSMSAPLGDESGDTPVADSPDTEPTVTPAESTESDDTDQDEESDDGNSDEEGATTGPIEDTGLSVDENRVYNQTRDVLSSNAPAPTIEIEELETRVGSVDRPLFDYLGLTNESDSDETGTSAAAVARGADTVVVNEQFLNGDRSSSTQRINLLLAHEFAHTIQYEEGWIRSVPPVLREELDTTTTSYRLLYRTLIEGGAVFAAEQYARETNLDRSQIERFERQYQGTTADRVFAYAPYHHGGQYFDAVLESGAGLGPAYEEDVPTSSSEILYPERETPEPISVNVSGESNHEEWDRHSSQDNRMGAMFVHIALTAHTDPETADDAAYGLVNDSVLAFGNSSRSSYAWATHWDTDTNADQFATAINETLTARSDEDVDQVDIVRAGNRSVVVLAGPETFLGAVTVDGKNTNLEIVLQSADAEPTEETAATASRGPEVTEISQAGLTRRARVPNAPGPGSVRNVGLECLEV